MQNKPLLLTLFLLTMLCFVFFTPKNTSFTARHHSLTEFINFNFLLDSLPHGYNSLFAGSGECAPCHGFDTAGIASVDLAGNDINLVDDWRATMMANAAKDPFWRAKVSHEVLINPEHQVEIESTCTTCHAPMGRYHTLYQGQEHYSIAEMLEDPLALDGVSCLVCHKQTPEMLGDLHSGHLNFDTAKVAFGPFQSPLESPMLMATDYKPVHSAHIQDAGICAGCHTLITGTLTPEGEPTLNTFVEQATYHEWLNSSYNTNNEASCQKCHMPALSKGEFFLVTDAETEPRSPFYLHTLTGANVFMLNLMKDNIEELGISATSEQYNATILSTYDMLQNRSVNLSIEPLDRNMDTAFVELTLENIAGHKFPSGYPSRRAFIRLFATTPEGDTLFQSGNWDDDYEVFGQDDFYEPHYQTIREENEVQIYELVVADVNGDRTTVLERMAYQLKDNRLTPKGFTSTAPTYDTVAIVGAALTDPDFNKEEGVEGSGRDKIQYHIPLNGYAGFLTVTANLYYQTAPPRWMEEMFAETTPEIETFRTMFEQADKTPTLVTKKNLDFDIFVATENVDLQTNWVSIKAVDVAARKVYISSSKLHDLHIFDVSGKLLRHAANKSGDYSIYLEKENGILLFQFRNEQGKIRVEKIIL